MANSNYADADDSDAPATDTATVEVWEGPQHANAADLIENETPDVYDIPISDPDYGLLTAVPDANRVHLATNIENHRTYAIRVVDAPRSVVLNVHTNSDYHDPHNWDDPIERGMNWEPGDDYPPYRCEMWGRVMMWVSETDD